MRSLYPQTQRQHYRPGQSVRWPAWALSLWRWL